MNFVPPGALRTFTRLACFVAVTAAASGTHAQPAEQPSAKAIERAELLRTLQTVVGLAGGLKIDADKRALREGETVRLTLDIPRAGYLNIVSVGPDGVPTVLFPNEVHSDNRVEPGRFTLPTPKMDFEIRAGAPWGTSTIAAFLTHEPANLYAQRDRAASAAGAMVERLARLSNAGRDLLDQIGTKTLTVVGTNAPLLAGLTTVEACAKDGPCADPGAPAAPTRLDTVLRLVDAFAPGILREPQDKALGDPPAKVRPVTEAGLRLTKSSEGWVPRLYEDAAGYCTIGYGHLLKLARCGAAEVMQYPLGITEAAGAELLVRDMRRAQQAVMQYVKVPINDHQYSALCDFAFNVGTGALRKSTLLKAINAGEHHRVPFQLRRWTMAGGRELRGLKIRRDREIALYFQGQVIPKAVPKGEVLTPVDVLNGE